MHFLNSFAAAVTNARLLLYKTKNDFNQQAAKPTLALDE